MLTIPRFRLDTRSDHHALQDAPGSLIVPLDHRRTGSPAPSLRRKARDRRIEKVSPGAKEEVGRVDRLGAQVTRCTAPTETQASAARRSGRLYALPAPPTARTRRSAPGKASSSLAETHYPTADDGYSTKRASA